MSKLSKGNPTTLRVMFNDKHFRSLKCRTGMSINTGSEVRLALSLAVIWPGYRLCRRFLFPPWRRRQTAGAHVLAGTLRLSDRLSGGIKGAHLEASASFLHYHNAQARQWSLRSWKPPWQQVPGSAPAASAVHDCLGLFTQFKGGLSRLLLICLGLPRMRGILCVQGLPYQVILTVRVNLTWFNVLMALTGSSFFSDHLFITMAGKQLQDIGTENLYFKFLSSLSHIQTLEIEIDQPNACFISFSFLFPEVKAAPIQGALRLCGLLQKCPLQQLQTLSHPLKVLRGGIFYRAQGSQTPERGWYVIPNDQNQLS